MRHAAAGLVGIVLVLSACSTGRDEEKGEKAEVWSVASEPETTIGQLDGDPRYLFEQVAGVRLLADERLVVADRGVGEVRVYGRDGSFIKGMGRAGQGPGEFDYLGGLVVAHPDTIVVYDGGLYRLTKFSIDGTLLETVNLRSDGGRAPELFAGRFDNGDLALAAMVRLQRDPTELTPDPMQFDRFRPDGEFVSVVGPARGMVRYGRGPVPFSPFLHSFVLRDSIYFTDGRSVLSVLGDGGAVVRTIALPSQGIDYSTALTRLSSRLETLGKTDQAGALSDVPASSIPEVAEVLLDDEGHFWLKHYVPEADSHWVNSFNWRNGGEWSVLDSVGGLVATIHLPEGFTPMDVLGDRIVGVTRDELGVQRVQVFSILRENG